MKQYYPRLFVLPLLMVLVLVLGACDPESVIVEPGAVGEEVIVEEEAEIVEEEPLAEVAGEIGVVGVGNGAMLATTLLDRGIDSLGGEDFGEIENLLIDLSTGNILFAWVEHGGFLDIGDTEIAVPLSALEWSDFEDELILAVPEEVLETFPEIKDDWALTLDPGWAEVTAFWADAGFDAVGAEEVVLDDVIKASEVVDYEVALYDAPGIGNVQNMIINLEQGEVEYLVLSFFDPGIYDGEEWIIVPFNAFEPTAFGAEFVLDEDFDSALLESAPRIDEVGLAGIDTLDPAWDDEVAEYWAAYGYGIEED